MILSHLTRGAWIEIDKEEVARANLATSHLTRGAWIEMVKSGDKVNYMYCRTSHEVRGLK